jgi:hypothetical protein
MSVWTRQLQEELVSMRLAFVWHNHHECKRSKIRMIRKLQWNKKNTDYHLKVDENNLLIYYW